MKSLIFEVVFSVSPQKGGKNDGYYGHMVEFGTKNMTAQPFMRPSFEKAGDASLEASKDYMMKRVDKEIAKL